jgi:hypothetical protein
VGTQLIRGAGGDSNIISREKWLKDRKGRTLSKADIAHYHKIVIALAETIRLMAEIDKVIEKYDGWPGAFTASAKDEEQQMAARPNEI